MLLILTGPTGSGKTSVALAAVQRHGWHLIETLTTRPARTPLTADTKKHVSGLKIASLRDDSEAFRKFSYQGYDYATPLLEAKRAAERVQPVSIIDWVHPHPEDLAFLGKHVLAVVLLPSPAALGDRLHKAHRHDRIARALCEREQVLSARNSYNPPWLVHEGDASVDEVVEFLATLVRSQAVT